MSEISRARRPFFAAKSVDKEGCIYYEEVIEFDWHKGLSWQVRQRSSISFANEIEKLYPSVKGRILEVSTKSSNIELGSALSAMNLKYTDSNSSTTYSIENWFQSSKQFSKKGELFGPYTDLLKIDPRVAKRYLNSLLDKKIIDQYKTDSLFMRIQKEIKNADLHSFVFLGTNYKLEPKSAFYDFIYVKALVQNHELSTSIKKYKVFTDIEFNPVIKGNVVRYNTQARACAIFVALSNRGILEEALKCFDSFITCVNYESIDSSDFGNCIQVELPLDSN